MNAQRYKHSATICVPPSPTTTTARHTRSLHLLIPILTPIPTPIRNPLYFLYALCSLCSPIRPIYSPLRLPRCRLS